jgi:exoribonuclease R
VYTLNIILVPRIPFVSLRDRLLYIVVIIIIIRKNVTMAKSKMIDNYWPRRSNYFIHRCSDDDDRDTSFQGYNYIWSDLPKMAYFRRWSFCYIILLYLFVYNPFISIESFPLWFPVDIVNDLRKPIPCFVTTQSSRSQWKQQQQQQHATIRVTRRTASSNSLTFLQSNAQQMKVHYQNLRNNGKWIPRQITDDDIFGSRNDEDLEQRAVELATNLVRQRLDEVKSSNYSSSFYVDDMTPYVDTSTVSRLVKGRFIDLACEKQGEVLLEMLFLSDRAKLIIQNYSEDEIRGAVIVVQSLCIMATQVGVKGPPEQLKRQVSHLDDRGDDPHYIQRDTYGCWDHDSVRRLKFRRDREPGLELLASLQRRRINQGAFDLLVDIGVWTEHEDLALLRSGFPLRFTQEEENDALRAFRVQHDPDSLLGIRQDLRHLKVYTIDGASASEIDDGLSIEKISIEVNDDADDSKKLVDKYRLWIHIADADRWAPRNSSLLEIARRRITSLYLPSGAIPMFPMTVSTDLMSLRARRDVCALSLGVELNQTDGSIDASTIVVTPSTINVNYRLTYDDVDEMMEEGIAYREEWQLGVLLDAAKKRREYRIANGSVEGAVPKPIPYGTVDLSYEKDTVSRNNNKVQLKLNIQVSHNGAQNKTSVSLIDSMNSNNLQSSFSTMEEPASSAYLLVTEAMILAGEAIGIWKGTLDKEESQRNRHTNGCFQNQLRLPFRTQALPGTYKTLVCLPFANR